jgi:hypothetical protein
MVLKFVIQGRQPIGYQVYHTRSAMLFACEVFRPNPTFAKEQDTSAVVS